MSVISCNFSKRNSYIVVMITIEVIILTDKSLNNLLLYVV